VKTFKVNFLKDNVAIQCGTKLWAKSCSSTLFTLQWEKIRAKTFHLTDGQKTGQKASVVHFSTYSVGQKYGQKALGVDISSYSEGQKTGQKP